MRCVHCGNTSSSMLVSVCPPRTWKTPLASAHVHARKFVDVSMPVSAKMTGPAGRWQQRRTKDLLEAFHRGLGCSCTGIRCTTACSAEHASAFVSAIAITLNITGQSMSLLMAQTKTHLVQTLRRPIAAQTSGAARRARIGCSARSRQARVRPHPVLCHLVLLSRGARGNGFPLLGAKYMLVSFSADKATTRQEQQRLTALNEQLDRRPHRTNDDSFDIVYRAAYDELPIDAEQDVALQIASGQGHRRCLERTAADIARAGCGRTFWMRPSCHAAEWAAWGKVAARKEVREKGDSRHRASEKCQATHPRPR